MLDFIFGPLLYLPAWLSIFILSLVVSLMIIIIQKYTTDQKFMKQAREDMKKFQKEINELSKKDPKKALAKQSKMMEINSKIMMQSFKPMIFYMIPVLVIFSWIMANYGVIGLTEGEDFSVTVMLSDAANQNLTLSSQILTITNSSGIITFEQGTIFKSTGKKEIIYFSGAKEGEYPIQINYGSESYVLDVTVSEDGKNVGKTAVTKRANFFGMYYGSTDGFLKDKSDVLGVSLNLVKFKPFGDYFNIFGYYPGCIMTYILFSILTSLLFRKLLNVY